MIIVGYGEKWFSQWDFWNLESAISQVSTDG